MAPVIYGDDIPYTVTGVLGPWAVSYLPIKTHGQSESHSLYTTNAYITIDAKVSDNVQGYMELETSDSDRAIGTTFIGDDEINVLTNNTHSTSGLYKWGSHDQKPMADLFFRQLWIQYTGSGLLGVPAGAKIGHQLLTLGEKQFLNHERFGDDAIVLFVQPTKELFIGGISSLFNQQRNSFSPLLQENSLKQSGRITQMTSIFILSSEPTSLIRTIPSGLTIRI